MRDSETGEFVETVIEPKYWQSTEPIRRIVRVRSEAANMPYFIPHTFRHAHASLSTRRCQSPEEYRAVSQNLGHENVETTLSSYAKLPPEKVGTVLASIDFTREGEDIFDADFKRKLGLLMSQKNKSLDT